MLARLTGIVLLAASIVAAPSGAAAAGAALSVGPGGDLQAAIDQARGGDTILLAPGATYVGNFVLRAKAEPGTITIRSAAPDAVLPGTSTRVTPADAVHFPILRSPNTQPALATEDGAHHYVIQFVEFQANAGGAGTIVALGDGSSRQYRLDQVPHDLVMDRVYIHGDPGDGQKRGIALNSAATSILNSHIGEIKARGQDSQAICGWNGPGPYLIANNYLEAAGENVMFGGADPAIQGLVPADITMVGNHVVKAEAWRGGPWVVKNLFELKNAQRVTVRGNVFEHNWPAAQSGYALLLKSVNQDGRAPWSTVQDVRFEHNVVRHVSSAINILGRDTHYPAIEARGLTFRHNLFTGISAARYGGNGRFLLINGGIDVTIDHNTVDSDGSGTVFADGEASRGFVFTNNIVQAHSWGFKGSGTAEGLGTIGRYFPGAVVTGNVLAGGAPALYPAGNFFPADLQAVGFVDFGGGDFRLSARSAFRGRALDGLDIGCDVSQLGAPAGPGPAPNPVAPPAPPRILSATTDGARVSLAWAAGGTGGPPSSYVIEAGTAPGLTDSGIFDTGSPGTAVVRDGVAPGRYFISVRAVNAAGISARSDEVALLVGSGPAACSAVDPPIGLRASTAGLRVRLDWEAPPGGCQPQQYILSVGTAPGAQDVYFGPIGPLPTVESAGAPGTYYVRVLAAYGARTSAPSNEIAVTLTP
ncbi:MAG: hypothetical protein AB7O67_10275 [Vicinamibacterales bacterium]